MKSATVLYREKDYSTAVGVAMLAEPKLRTSESFFAAAVKDGFVVSLFSAEQVIHNACEFVSCGGDCLGFAELPSDTPK